MPGSVRYDPHFLVAPAAATGLAEKIIRLRTYQISILFTTKHTASSNCLHLCSPND